MKTITIDDELYRYIVGHTEYIGENASSILRRLLAMTPLSSQAKLANQTEQATINTVVDLLKQPYYLQQSNITQRFLQLLACCYQYSPERFAKAALQQQGRTRQYFAQQASELLAAGKQTRPQAIAHSPYWVITNTNSQRKRQITLSLMLAMGFPKPLSDMAADSLLVVATL